jgi:hypothetical protein
MPTPQTLEDVKANPKMMAAFLAYSKRRQTLNEVLFYFDKGNAAGIYPKYIDSKSPQAANLSSVVTDPADELAGKGDFANPKWAEILKKGKDEIAHAVGTDVGMGFIASPEYKDYLKKEKMGDPTKAAKVLGIKDVKKLTKAMEAAATGNKKEAEKLLGELAKAEKLAQKAADMLKALEKAGLV